MKKSTAHFILLIFDVLALLALGWCVFHLRTLETLLARNAGEIHFEPSLLYMSFSVVVPIMHGFSFLNESNRGWMKAIGRKLGLFLVLAITIIGVLKYWVVSKIEKDLELNDYVLCDEYVKGRYSRAVYQKSVCDS